VIPSRDKRPRRKQLRHFFWKLCAFAANSPYLITEIMNCLAGCVRQGSRGVPDCSRGLIRKPFRCEILISGDSAQSFFKFPGQLSAGSRRTLLSTPTRYLARSGVSVIAANSVLGTRAVKQIVGGKA
jgi:hypothetical protein